VFSELQLYVVEVELLLILLHERILRFREYLDESAFVEFMQHTAHGQASDKFRNQTETNQIFRLYGRERFRVTMHAGLYLRLEAKRLVTKAPLDHFFQSHERATANEQNICGVDREEFLVWMFATT